MRYKSLINNLLRWIFLLLLFLVCFLKIQGLELWQILRNLYHKDLYSWQRFWEVTGWGLVFCGIVLLMKWREEK